MPTIEIPRFWVFRMPCGCVYGSLVADQRFPGMPDGQVIATAEHAWSDFYEGRKREREKAKKAGRQVTPENDLPPIEAWAHKTYVDGVCSVHGPSPVAETAATTRGPAASREEFQSALDHAMEALTG
jgi:hypothetical protein